MVIKMKDFKTEVITARLTEKQREQLNKIIELHAEKGIKKTVTEMVNESLEIYFKRKVIYSSDPVRNWRLTDRDYVEAWIPKNLQFVQSDVLEVMDQDIRALINGKYKQNASKRNILMIGNEMLRTVRAMREFNEVKKDYYINELEQRLKSVEKKELREKIQLMTADSISE